MASRPYWLAPLSLSERILPVAGTGRAVTSRSRELRTVDEMVSSKEFQLGKLATRAHLRYGAGRRDFLLSPRRNDLMLPMADGGRPVGF